uniref:LEM domain-containing protein n=1 Tax=Strongyloides venezuelensis TaxID=75913 RepID=A0A0K0EUG7_STRVS
MTSTGLLKWRFNPLYVSTESLMGEIPYELDDQEPLAGLSLEDVQSVNELSHRLRNLKIRGLSKYSRVYSERRKAYFIAAHSNKRSYRTPPPAMRNRLSQTPDSLRTKRRDSFDSLSSLISLSSPRPYLRTPRLNDRESSPNNTDTTGDSLLIKKRHGHSRLKRNPSKIKPRDLFGSKKIRKVGSCENHYELDVGSNDSGICLNESPIVSEKNVQVFKRKPLQTLKRRHCNEQLPPGSNGKDKSYGEYNKRSRTFGDDLNF